MSDRNSIFVFIAIPCFIGLAIGIALAVTYGIYLMSGFRIGF